MKRLFATSLLITMPFIAHAAPQLDLSAGELRFVWTPGRHAQLWARGVPVIHESHLFMIKSGWTGVWMNQDDLTGITTSSRDGGISVGTAAYETDDAAADYRFELHPDNVFRMSVTYRMKTAKPTEVEFNNYLNANLFRGKRYSLDTESGARTGLMPEQAQDSASPAGRMGEKISNVRFETVLGPVVINVEGSDPACRQFTLYDARGIKVEWAKKNPIFWFGANIPDMPAPGRQTITVTYRFDLPPKPPTGMVVRVDPKIINNPLAQTPYVPELPIIPRPKEYTSGRIPMRLDGVVAIVLPPEASHEEKVSAREIQAELQDDWGLATKITRDAAGQSPAIFLNAGRTSETVKGLPAEGYFLEVVPDRAVVMGRDGRGVYNGVQTLKQLIRADEKGVYLRGAVVRDWPSLPLRGVHWFGGPDSWPFHQKMITRIIAPFKMNTMQYEMEYMHFDSQPEARDLKRGMPKSDVRKTVELARAHLIEPIPHMPTLGNADYLFHNGQNKDIAFDPRAPRSYDPRQPRSYEVLFRCFEEVLDVFKPRYFHIGHDEITFGPPDFPPVPTKESAEELIIEDTRKLHSWLKERGIETIMWGDQMLHAPNEATDAGWAPTMEFARALRDALPKDIIIGDWHYQGDDPRYPSVEVFQKSGYQKIIGATWFDWRNIRDFTRVLVERKALGLIQTTWAGWQMSLDLVNNGNPFQFVAYLVAAETAWNGGLDPENLGYNPDEAFRLAWNRKPVDLTVREGFLVEFPMGPEIPGLPRGVNRWGGTFFHTRNVIPLRGGLDPGAHPEAVSLDMKGRQVSELRFLWGTTHSTDKDTPVADVDVTFEDGEIISVAIRYAHEIAAFDDNRGAGSAVSAWRKPGSDPYIVRWWGWTNPRPDAKIRTVTVRSLGTEAAPLLLGLTGVSIKGS